jgi:hypothetical protein
VVVSAGLFAFVAFKVDLKGSLALLWDVDLGLLLLAVGLTFLLTGHAAYRWYILLIHRDAVSYWAVLRLTIVSALARLSSGEGRRFGRGRVLLFDLLLCRLRRGGGSPRLPAACEPFQVVVPAQPQRPGPRRTGLRPAARRPGSSPLMRDPATVASGSPLGSQKDGRDPPMRIGVMLRHVSMRGGIGNYTRQLVGALLAKDRVNEYVMYYGSSDDLGRFTGPNITERVVRLRSRLLWDQWAIPRQAAADRVDLIFNLKLSVPLHGRVPAIFVLHGPEQFVVSSAYPPLDRWQARIMLPRYVRSAAAVIVSTEDAKAKTAGIARSSSASPWRRS